MATAKKIVAPSLLNSTNHVLVLIDQQYSPILTVRSHDVERVVNAATLLAKRPCT